jgi:nucleoside-diphosphate-sugar epimerase
MSSDIILTGTRGWLGSRMLHALIHGLPDYPDIAVPSGSNVRCFYRTGETLVDVAQSAAVTTNIEPVFGDLTRPEDCDRLFQQTDGALLIHTAGVIHPQRVRDLYSANVDATLNLLKAGSRAGCRRAVIVSSNSPIGCNPNPEHRFDENSPYNPYQNYGRSKMEMELRARDFAAELGIELVIIRPPWFYGPFQPARQTLFFSMIKEGKGPLLGNGINQRSMVYMDNLCQGLALAGRLPQAAGQTYWIADAEPYSMQTILDTIESVLEQDFHMQVAHKRLRLPGVVGEIAYLADAAIQAAGFYHQKIHVLSEMNKSIACNIEKARQELGYEPKIALREGMRRSIQWCIDQGQVI